MRNGCSTRLPLQSYLSQGHTQCVGYWAPDQYQPGSVGEASSYPDAPFDGSNVSMTLCVLASVMVFEALSSMDAYGPIIKAG